MVDPAHTHTGGTATCKKKAVCTICEKEYGELAEHNYGAWSVTKNPSETSTGTAEHVCTNDSTHKETKQLSALTDINVWTKVTAECIAPTETKDGKDVYQSVNFGKVTVVIPKMGGGNNNDNNDNNNNNSGSNSNSDGSSSGSKNPPTGSKPRFSQRQFLPPR